MTVSFAAILHGVRTTLNIGQGVVQSHDELTEAIVDLPCLQIYPEFGSQDPSSETDRTTFGGGNDPMRQSAFTVIIDVYAKARADISEDFAKLVTVLDLVIAALETQNQKPYFGVAGIQAFHYTWNRVTFTTAGQSYVGVRFTLDLRIF